MIRRCSLLLVVLALGCKVGPDYEAPEIRFDDAWHQAAVQGLEEGTADLETWWSVFEDPLLDELIARTKANNLAVRLAVLRIREARAGRGIAGGQLVPSLGGSASYTRLQSSDENLNGVVEERTADVYQAGFDATWEIDVWGGIRRGIESADANQAAAVEDYRDTLVSLLAEVATNYVRIRVLQEQVRDIRSNIERQQRTLEMTRARFRGGLVSELDVREAERNVATTSAGLPALEIGLAHAIHRLSTIVAEPPSALFPLFAQEGPIPQPPTAVAFGVPADLLRQRPDLRRAERTLAAATAQIGVAASDLYPRLSLFGSIGFDATEVAKATTGATTFGVGPSLRWNIFDGARNYYRIALQEVITEQAWVAYERSVLQALRDVEDAMVALRKEEQRRDVLRQAVTAAERSTDLVRATYLEGLTNFQNVLDVERALVNLQVDLASSEGAVTQNLIALYKALGGGWSPDEIAQVELLEQDSPSIDRPVKYFFTGGGQDLPWRAASATEE